MKKIILILAAFFLLALASCTTIENDVDKQIPNQSYEFALSETTSNIIGTISDSYHFSSERYFQYFSPDGQWVYTLDELNRLTIRQTNNMLLQQYYDFPRTVENGTLDFRLDFRGWSPDSTGLVFGNGGEGSGVSNPIWIGNIVDGTLQTPIMYSFQEPVYVNGLLWSPSGDLLFAIDFISEDGYIRIFEFSRQLELRATYEIPLPDEILICHIFAFTGGFLISETTQNFENQLVLFSTEDQSVIEYFIDNYDFVYYICGISPDLTRILIAGAELDSVLYFSNFLLLNINDGSIEERYDISMEEGNYSRYYTNTICYYSWDNSLLAFAGENEGSEQGVIFWNWDNLEFTFFPGTYDVLGWNRTYNGFTVIDRSQEDIMTVEVLVNE